MAKPSFDRGRRESIQPSALQRIDTERAELFVLEDFLDPAECRRVIEIMTAFANLGLAIKPNTGRNPI